MKVSKEGYFDGNGIVIPYLDTSIRANMTLVKKTANTSGLSNEKITYEDGNLFVELNANVFTINDLDYSGEINIASKFHFPSDSDFNQIFPGQFFSENSEGRKILEPYSILNFELFDNAGNQLNISSPAKLVLPIDPFKLSEAPDQVAMWYLDIETGFWIEDGTAIRNGTNYETEVSHFTLWCPALASSVIEISGSVIQNDMPFPHARMEIEFADYKSLFFSATDGSYKKYIAKNKDFDLLVKNRCQEVISTNSITGSETDFIYDVNISSSFNFITIAGMLTCPPENEVSSSYVVISNGIWTEVVIPEENGTFNYQMQDCENVEISVVGFDPISDKRSSIQTITGSSTDLVLDVCTEELLGSITINMEGEEPHIINDCRMLEREDREFPFSGAFYKLEAVDNFDGSGEYAIYDWIEIYVDDPLDTEAASNPVGPVISSIDFSENVPYHFFFSPVNPILIEENEIFVTILIPETDIIRSDGSGGQITKQGSVTFNAIK